MPRKKEWYTTFGLESNPFTTDPFEADYTFVNYNDVIEELIYQVKAGNMYILAGEDGSGKTMMLRQIIKVYGGAGRVLYIDGNKISKGKDIEKELDKSTSLLRKIRNKKPKRLILLLDNAEKIDSINMQKLKYYYDQDYVQSVVFTTTKSEDLNLSSSIKDRIATNHRTIPPLINYDALRIVRDRFNDHFFLPDEIILKLHKKSKGNVKQLLINCEKVCAYVVKQGKGEVLHKYIRLALQEKHKKAATSSKSVSGKQQAVASE